MMSYLKAWKLNPRAVCLNVFSTLIRGFRTTYVCTISMHMLYAVHMIHIYVYETSDGFERGEKGETAGLCYPPVC